MRWRVRLYFDDTASVDWEDRYVEALTAFGAAALVNSDLERDLPRVIAVSVGRCF